jgi:hypothetical protein
MEGTTWTVAVYQGADEGYESADPYLTDDRGLYFDGINDFATVRGLLIHDNFTISMWINPESSGTLYSSS